MSRFRLASALGLLALVPTAVFALDRGTVIPALSVVSVLLIVGSLYYMLGPSEESADHAAEGATDHAAEP